jgi:hypothetical protein
MFHKFATIVGFGIIIFSSGAALAQSSHNILQSGGAKGERVSMTGVQYKREGNAGVYRGRTALLGDTPVKSVEERQQVEIEIRSRHIPAHGQKCHPPARLRTQGFYSGTGSTYPFTQGFYSGQRIFRPMF